MTRRILAALCAAFLLLALAEPATAKAPSTVKGVQVVKASTSSLTLTWPRVKGAKRYDVFFSTSYAKVNKGKRRKTGKSSTYTVRGLRSGTTYCFSVRAMRGGSVGKRSQRTCKPTVRKGGASSGFKLRVVTFNTCSRVCGYSPTRTRRGQSLLTNARPDIIALQEANYFGAPAGYASAQYSNGKRLLYKTSTLSVSPGVPQTYECGEDPETGEPVTCTEPTTRAGTINLGHDNWAVWAELVHKATKRRVIAVSAHLGNGKSRTAANRRTSETKRLLAEVAKIRRGLYVVYAGDFNSNKNRGSLDTVGRTMNRAGYIDSFDLARALASPNWNSSLLNGKPKFGVKWGDHVDHVWVSSRIGVRTWSKLGPRTKPYASSDHFPVRVDLTIR